MVKLQRSSIDGHAQKTQNWGADRPGGVRHGRKHEHREMHLLAMVLAAEATLVARERQSIGCEK